MLFHVGVFVQTEECYAGDTSWLQPKNTSIRLFFCQVQVLIKLSLPVLLLLDAWLVWWLFSLDARAARLRLTHWRSRYFTRFSLYLSVSLITTTYSLYPYSRTLSLTAPLHQYPPQTLVLMNHLVIPHYKVEEYNWEQQIDCSRRFICQSFWSIKRNRHKI